VPVIESDGDDFDEEDVDEADREVVDQIKELLDTRCARQWPATAVTSCFAANRDGIVRLHCKGPVQAALRPARS